MRGLRVPVVAALLLAISIAPMVHAGGSSDPVVVAVLDTGIRASHEAFEDGQVVAWWDFGRCCGRTVPTETWDDRQGPYDEQGHGTAVASMVAGVGRHTPSHAPGTDLAIAKISGRDGSASDFDTGRAIRWAVDTVGADVISLSFYSYLPEEGVGDPVLEALEYARSQGVLPVVLTGNGMNNAGLPTMSWVHPPASSPHALVVGGAYGPGQPVSPQGSMDPEVVARYTATVALPCSDTCYGRWSGTSFSTPLVAGMAADLIRTARDEGLAEPTPDRLETLLKRAALDDAATAPTLEGYGWLDGDRLDRARDHLRQGTTPDATLHGQASAAYVEVVQQTERAAWSADPDGLPAP